MKKKNQIFDITKYNNVLKIFQCKRGNSYDFFLKFFKALTHLNISGPFLLQARLTGHTEHNKYNFLKH